MVCLLYKINGSIIHFLLVYLILFMFNNLSIIISLPYWALSILPMSNIIPVQGYHDVSSDPGTDTMDW